MITSTVHASPLAVRVDGWMPGTPPKLPIDSEAFIAAAGDHAGTLPDAVRTQIAEFRSTSSQTGALLLRGLDVGVLPATPARPTETTSKDHTSEFTLLGVAKLLGEPVGYEPEHGGDIIQNIVPTASAADRQVSTSSKVTLMFHTEAAFHPHRPRYLLLLCLRGDPAARTTLASINEVLPLLPTDVVDTLFQPRFRTAVDESYLHGRANTLGAPMSVLTGDRDRPTMVFDADLMVGIDADADAAIRTLADAVSNHHTGVVLEAGDLLIVDNRVAVHGRSPFQARFDGTDRWLQRTFVIDSLVASRGDRHGRVITTRFGE